MHTHIALTASHMVVKQKQTSDEIVSDNVMQCAAALVQGGKRIKSTFSKTEHPEVHTVALDDVKHL